MPPDAKTVPISWVSDRHLRVELGDDTSLEAHRKVRAALEHLRQAPPLGLRDATPAYATLLLAFDLRSLDPDLAERQVRAALTNLDSAPQQAPSRLIEIPVCYEKECAPDIDDVAALHGLDRATLVRLHSQAEYLVHFIGFSPGFPYLGGLPHALATPRLDKPRPRVPAGSVGIAGTQTGVYPRATPGGWRLIGRTPLSVFDARQDPPALLRMGDRVRFSPIGLDRYRTMAAGGD